MKIYERNHRHKIMIQKMDITTADVDAIVNAANKSLLGGGGVDGAIHRAAGPALFKECVGLNGCNTGEAKITKGYLLKAPYVIHTVGPIYRGKGTDAEYLRQCYQNSLELAKTHNLHSIAFPGISTGVYGYPVEEATKVSTKAVQDWLDSNPQYEMLIVFACFSEHATSLYEEIWEIRS